MLKRKIQTEIREYLTSDCNKVLVVDGARQIGKSYIILTISTPMLSAVPSLG